MCYYLSILLVERRIISDHKHHIEAVYQAKHDLDWKQRQIEEAEKRKLNYKKLFVEIQKLGPYDTFVSTSKNH